MMTNKQVRPKVRHIELPWGAWYAEGRHTLEIPDECTVDVLWPNGGQSLAPGELHRALEVPHNSPPVEEVVGPRDTVCIAVDDLARPTRAGDILEAVLARLAKRGVSRSSIRIVIATGSHGPVKQREFEKKLGRHVSQNLPVESHRCRGVLASTGIRFGERELLLNRTFMSSSKRLLITTVLPHSFAGYSGGAKLVIPGLADIHAIHRSHKFVELGLRGGAEPSENRFRTEAEEYALRVGVHFTVCTVVNPRCETVAIAAGDAVAAHRAAVRVAIPAYKTNFRNSYDVLILNAYPKDVDLVQSANAFQPLKASRSLLMHEGSVLVLCTASSQGLGAHGLFAPGGLSYRAPRPLQHLGGRELWIYAPSVHASDIRKLYWDGYSILSKPTDLSRSIRERFPFGARIAVLPCAPMQQLEAVAESDA